MAKLNIKLNKRSDDSKSDQISIQIEQQIKGGVLKAGDLLPSSYVLGSQLGVSKATVLAAYKQLADRRLIETIERVGSQVRAGKSKTGKSGIKGK